MCVCVCVVHWRMQNPKGLQSLSFSLLLSGLIGPKWHLVLFGVQSDGGGKERKSPLSGAIINRKRNKKKKSSGKIDQLAIALHKHTDSASNNRPLLCQCVSLRATILLPQYKNYNKISLFFNYTIKKSKDSADNFGNYNKVCITNFLIDIQMIL